MCTLGLLRKYGLMATGCALLILLVWRADAGLLLTVLVGARPELVAIAALLQLVTIAAIIGQWTDLGRRLGSAGNPVTDHRGHPEASGHGVPRDRLQNPDCSWRVMLRINLLGTFWETVTPALKSGGELAKVYLLRRDCGWSLGRAVALTGLQKIVSLLPFLLLAALAMLFFLGLHGWDTPQGRLLVPSCAGLALLLSGLAAAALAPRPLLALVAWLPLPRRFLYRRRLLKGMAEFRRALARLWRSPSALIGHLLLATAIWLLFPYKAWLLACSLGLPLELWQAALITYLAYIVAMLPLTPGGLGTFEATVIFLAAPFGVAPAPALAFAVLLRLVTFWLPFLLSALYMSMSQLAAVAEGLPKTDKITHQGRKPCI